MHVEIRASDDNRGYKPFTVNTGSDNPARTLAAFEAHLNRTGKILYITKEKRLPVAYLFNRIPALPEKTGT